MKKLYLLLLPLTLCFGLVSSSAFAQDKVREKAQTEDLTDYKTACYAAIDNLSEIGKDNRTIRSMLSTTRYSVSLYDTKEDLQTAMIFLRAEVLNYLQVVKSFNEGQVFTGLIGNHSFDTGDLSLWNCFSFNLSQIKLSDITAAIALGDVSGLVKAVSLSGWNEGTKAVENKEPDAIPEGHNKYYLNSNQLIMEPIFGLPAGVYSLQANLACKPGLLNLNKVHLNALVVSAETLMEILGVTLSNSSDWRELLSNFNLGNYIEPIFEKGKLYSASASCKNLNTFSDGELRFVIDKGDLVIIGLDAGLVSFIGAEQFRADNLKLIGLWSADTFLAAKDQLAADLEGQTVIEANYNADAIGSAPQRAFTYNKTITQDYNKALLAAQDKYDDRLADIITEDDLDNLNSLDIIVNNHFNPTITAFRNAKMAFYRQGFIAPQADETFNILMKDEWTSLFSSKWTGNAVTASEDMKMSFSQKPGTSLYTLAFSFERASSDYSNLLRAFVNDNHDKYYLGEKNGNLVLTTNQSEAVTITALPSYTEEGLINLMVGDMYLGTSSSSNALIKTDDGTLLRPTRTGLAVAPASEMELTVTVPAGWNASTMMLPFDADLPGGLNAFTVTGINGEIPYLEKESQTSLKANTPYYITARAGSYTLSGVSRLIQPSYEEGLLVGRHTPYTTQGADEYVLTIEDGYYMFRQMNRQPIAANNCYLKCDEPTNLICVNKDDATGVNDLKDFKDSKSFIYNLSGQKMNGQLPQGIYIRDGKKILR